MKRETSPLSIWLPVALWTAVIAFESAAGSTSNTAPFFYPLIAWLFHHPDPARFDLIHHIARKAGHFFGYGILGYLWFRAYLRTLKLNTLIKCAALAILCTFLTASLDEWHQSFSPARTGQFRDVLLDTCGALVLIALALPFATRRHTNSRPEHVAASTP